MTENNGILDGKVVVITGAARGLGQAYAVAFTALGAAVVAADLGNCNDTVAMASVDGGRCIGVEADVTDGPAVNAMAAAAVEAFGGIDALVNTAALYGALHGGRQPRVSDLAVAVGLDQQAVVGTSWPDCRSVFSPGLPAASSVEPQLATDRLAARRVARVTAAD